MNSGNQPPEKLTPGSLAGKLREKDLLYCLKGALRTLFHPIYRPENRLLSPFRFLITLFRLLFSGKRKKVILGIWDYKIIPWSAGDFLVFIETLSVLKLKHGADKVDICVVCDSENPAGKRGYKNINAQNFRYYLFNLLPIISTSPYLGSIFQFDSRSEFNSFLRQNINEYELYPPISRQLAETFNYYGGATLEEIQDFYREHGYIPYLNIDDHHLNWAYKFYKTKAKDLLPVVVSLRWHPHATVHRNAEREVWLDFFNQCRSKFPDVVFIVVGSREEVFEGLRKCKNVIVAKDHGSTLLEDLAFIKTSLLYMAQETGVSIIAIFSDTPYLLFGREEVARKALKLEHGANFEFATQYQKVLYSDFKITKQSLLEEFSGLYNQLDTGKWREKASAYDSTPYTFAV